MPDCQCGYVFGRQQGNEGSSEKKRKALGKKHCPQCHAESRRNAPECDKCKHVFSPKLQKIERKSDSAVVIGDVIKARVEEIERRATSEITEVSRKKRVERKTTPFSYARLCSRCGTLHNVKGNCSSPRRAKEKLSTPKKGTKYYERVIRTTPIGKKSFARKSHAAAAKVKTVHDDEESVGVSSNEAKSSDSDENGEFADGELDESDSKGPMSIKGKSKFTDRFLGQKKFSLDVEKADSRCVKFWKTMRGFRNKICASCHMLYSMHGTRPFHHEMQAKLVHLFLKSKLASETFTLSSIYDNLPEAWKHNDPAELRICQTCLRHVAKRKTEMPRKCFLNGLMHGRQPEALQGLVYIERRLIALNNIFGRIFRLPRGGQAGLKGRMLYVPNVDFKTVAESILSRNKSKGNGDKIELPRELDEREIMLDSINEYLNVRYPSAKDAIGALVNTHARRIKVRDALVYLRKENGFWANIKISEKRLSQYRGKEKQEFNFDDFEHYTSKDDEPELQIPKGEEEKSEKEKQDDEIKLQWNLEPRNFPDEPNVEARSFPDLFPTGRGCFTDHGRLVKISRAEYCQSKLLNGDSRFRKEASYLFFALELIESERLRNYKNIMCKMTTNEKTLEPELMKAGDVRQVERDEQLRRLRGCYFSMNAQWRGSSGFWKKWQRKLMAQITQAEQPPTWFVTFSCNENWWSDLHEFLLKSTGLKKSTAEVRKLVESMKHEEFPPLVKGDAVLVLEYCHKRFEQFLRNVLVPKDGKTGPLGTILDYCFRAEFQKRGSIHFHGFLMVKGAPQLTKKSRIHAPAFIDKYVTTALKPPLLRPEDGETERDVKLRNLVDTVQRHKCKDYYCTKPRFIKKKEGMVEVNSCRFGFPFKERAETIVKIPAEGAPPSRRCFVLKRAKESLNINGYNPECLATWGANMDVQFVGSYRQALYYMLYYMTKGETREMLEELNRLLGEMVDLDMPMRERIQKLNAFTLRKREIGVQEAACLIFGKELVMTSRQFVDVQAKPPDKRVYVSKRPEELLQCKDDDVGVYAGRIEKYTNRPAHLEKLTYWEYESRWQYVYGGKGKEKLNDEVPDIDVESGDEGADNDGVGGIYKGKNGKGKYRKRKREAVLNLSYVSYERDPESHAYAFLLLCCPFRKESELLESGRSAREELKYLRGLSKEHDADEKVFREAKWMSNLLEKFDVMEEMMADDPQDEPGKESDDEIVIEQEVDDRKKEYEEMGLGVLVGDAAEEPFHDEIEVTVGRPDIDMLEPVFVDDDEESNKRYRMTNESYENARNSCNAKQTYVVQIIEKYFDDRDAWLLKVEEEGEINEPPPEPPRLFVSGAGGRGKSHLLKTVRELVERRAPNAARKPACSVMAPTGVAAYLIGGTTLHRGLGLPSDPREKKGSDRARRRKGRMDWFKRLDRGESVAKNNPFAEYGPLETTKNAQRMPRMNLQTVQNMRVDWKNFVCALVDEVSMISNVTLEISFARFQLLKEVEASITGGLIVLFFGDFYQLPPVDGDWAFMSAMWRGNFRLVELTENMRQDKDKEFGTLCDHAREGKLTKKDKALLDSRRVTNPANNISLEDEKWQGALRIFTKRARVADYNNRSYTRLKTKKYVVNAVDELADIWSKDTFPGLHVGDKVPKQHVPVEDKNCGGMVKRLKVAVGAKVMLLRNLDVADGLTNGAVGEVTEIETGVVKTNFGENVPVVNAVWVKFDNHEVGQKGVKCAVGEQEAVKILSIRVKYKLKNEKLGEGVRVQIPVDLCFAATAHKVQGQSLDAAVVYMGKADCFEDHIAYVVLSRARTLDGIALVEWDHENVSRRFVDPYVPRIYEMMRTETTGYERALYFGRPDWLDDDKVVQPSGGPKLSGKKVGGRGRGKAVPRPVPVGRGVTTPVSGKKDMPVEIEELPKAPDETADNSRERVPLRVENHDSCHYDIEPLFNDIYTVMTRGYNCFGDADSAFEKFFSYSRIGSNVRLRMSSLRSLLEPRIGKFRLGGVRGDGLCLFHALTLGFTGDDEVVRCDNSEHRYDFELIRDSVLMYMVKYHKVFTEYHYGRGPEASELLKSRVDQVRLHGAWGGSKEIDSFTGLFDLSVVVAACGDNIRSPNTFSLQHYNLRAATRNRIGIGERGPYGPNPVNDRQLKAMYIVLLDNFHFDAVIPLREGVTDEARCWCEIPYVNPRSTAAASRDAGSRVMRIENHEMSHFDVGAIMHDLDVRMSPNRYECYGMAEKALRDFISSSSRQSEDLRLLELSLREVVGSLVGRFRLAGVKGDGNCLPRALSVALTGYNSSVLQEDTDGNIVLLEDWKRLKSAIFAYERENFEQLAPVLGVGATLGAMRLDFDEHIKTISKDGEWCTEREIMALSAMFDISVTVVFATNQNLEVVTGIARSPNAFERQRYNFREMYSETVSQGIIGKYRCIYGNLSNIVIALLDRIHFDAVIPLASQFTDESLRGRCWCQVHAEVI